MPLPLLRAMVFLMNNSGQPFASQPSSATNRIPAAGKPVTTQLSMNSAPPGPPELNSIPR